LRSKRFTLADAEQTNSIFVEDLRFAEQKKYLRLPALQIGPPAIIIEVFPRNESDGTRFSLQKNYHQMVKRLVIYGYYSWPGEIESFATAANLSALDIH